jgi:polysaccharide chain length determinant protein (PEP-CTERM system associated)
VSGIPRPVEDDEAGKRPLHLRELLHRRRWWGRLTLLGCLGGSAAFIAALPDVYRSSATILIERQQIPDELVRSTVTSGLEVRLQMISQEILSRSRLEALINQYALYPELRGQRSQEHLIDRMRRDVQVEMRGGEQKRGDRSTVAFSVSYRSLDPSKAAAVANAIASLYIEENLKVRERQAVGTADFLRTQLEQLKATLAEQETRVSAFKEKNLGQLPQQLDANLKTLDGLNGQLRLNSDSQVQAAARRAALEGQLTEAMGLAGTGPSALAARLAEQRKALADLLTQYTEQYPDVVRLRGEIQRLEAQLAAAGGSDIKVVSDTASPQVLQLRRSIADVDLELARLRAEAERLRASIALYQKRIEAAPTREQEFQALSREYETTQEQYRSLVARQSEADLAESMEQRQKGELFRVIEPALPAQDPTAPRRGRLFILALVLAVALAAGVMLVREAFDGTIHTRDDVVARTTLPLLAVVPLLLSEPDRRRRRRRLVAGALVAVTSLCVLVATSYRVARGNVALAVLVSR